MVAVLQDIEIEQYSTFRLPIVCYERDPTTLQLAIRNLTGWTGSMQVRSAVDATAVLATAVVTIDVTTGVVTATITAAVTGTYTWRTGVYDLIITNGTDTDQLARGDAKLIRGVTRS